MTKRVSRVVVVVAVVALLAGLGVFMSVSSMFFMGAGIQNLRSSAASDPACTDTSAPALSVDADSLPDVSGYTAEQLSVAAQIMTTGEDLELPERAQLVALVTAMQESTLANLAGGDRDSVGAFQQRPSQGWGTAEQLRDASYAARAFFQGVDAPSGHIPGLVDIEGWEQMTLTEAASAVQRPAEKFEGEYAKHESEARRLMAELSGVSMSEASGSLTDASLGCAAPAAAAAVGDLPTQEELTQDSANVACPEGSTDLGASSGGFQGQRIPIRLCSITDTVCTGSDCRAGSLAGMARGEVVLNSLVAPHFIAWLAGVREDGYNPTFNSSYRSWSTQLSLSGSSNAARVGWSNHQMGAAVDISGLPGSYTRHNCSGFTDDGSCKSPAESWQSYHKRGLENGAVFHDQEFWHLEWVVTRAEQREVPFILAA